MQSYYDDGHHIRDCYKRFNIDYRIWKLAQDLGWVTPRTPNESKKLAGVMKRTISDEMMFCADSLVGRCQVRERILQDSLLTYECTECDCLPEWRGKPMSLVLDHINGVNNDHRLENLRFLCPNCNSQTDTFSGRNKAYQRERLAAL